MRHLRVLRLLTSVIAIALTAFSLSTCAPTISASKIGQTHRQPYLTPGDSLVFLSYNVENLFDTINDPKTHDDEFTPEGIKQWDGPKYRSKLKHIARVISDAGYLDFPTFVGLMEVENETVVKALSTAAPLRNAGYHCIVSNGQDPRGIDVALLYRKAKFKPYSVLEHNIHFQGQPHKHTRPILCVSGITSSQDTLHIILCHFPSKRGGQSASAPYRLAASETLFSIVDSLAQSHSQAKIIAMGDFNASPDELSDLWESVSAQPSFRNWQTTMLNPFDQRHLRPRGKPGSYYYKGRWQQIDQIWLSKTLFCTTNNSWTYRPTSAENVAFNYMLRKTRTQEPSPKRCYYGNFFANGYSDHLPIRLVLERTKNDQ